MKDKGTFRFWRTALEYVLAGMALALLLACCPSAFALDPSLDISQYAHTAWKVREGFSKGIINALAQTSDGYLWVGTEFGLLRFDGVRSVPWEPPAGQYLPYSYISALLAARDGTLWIGTRKGLASWKDGKLTQYPELAGQAVLALLEDREGTVWAGGWALPTGRLCAIQGGSAQCYGKDGSLGWGVESLYEDGRGNLWAGGHAGVWRWKPGPAKFYGVPDPQAVIDALIEGDHGALLMAMRGGITQLVDGKAGAYPLPPTERPFWPYRLLRDRDGGLWIGTGDQGLVHVHQGRMDVFGLPDGLSSNSVHALLEDRKGNIWAGTLHGLDRFRSLAVPTISAKQGLPITLVLAVLPARDGSVWLGTNDGLIQWKDGQNTIYRRRSSGLPDDEVESLFQDASGRIWVATRGGVVCFENGRFVPISGVPGGYMPAIAGDSAGNLWIAHHNEGLFHLRGQSVVEQLPWAKLGLKDYATDLFLDPWQGGLWLGFFEGGVAYFRDGQVRATYAAAEGLGKGTVSGLELDKDGTLWAATEGGLSRVKDGRVATLTSKNGLPCDAVNGMMEDDAQAFWLYMTCGLVRVDRTDLEAWAADPKRTIQATVFDSSDGVRVHWDPTYRTPRVAKSADGKIWFLPQDGVSVIDPRHLAFNNLPPPVHIEQITADRKTYWQNSRGDASSRPPRLPPRVRDLTINYTALSLVAPEKVRFRFKLEGQDPDWREVANDREVQYSNLAPGNYRFRVTACNNSGVWNKTGDTLDFSITPAYYQTLWFRLACVAAFLVLIWGLYRLRLRTIEQRSEQLAFMNAKLEAEIAERQRAEDALRRSQAYLTEAQLLSHTGSFGWKPSTGEIRWSEETYRIFQYDRTTKPTLELVLARVHPEDRALAQQIIERASKEQKDFEHEYRLLMPDGSVKFLHIVAHALSSESGSIEFVGAAMDVTAAKQAEEALRGQADLLNLTHDTIFVMTMGGMIKYWNRGAEEQYGWTAEQAVGRSVHALLKTVFPAPLEQIKAEVVRTGRWEGELVHTKKDETQVVVASRWSLQRGEQGAPIAILETNNDITERKRAEEALGRSNRELRAISNCNQTLLRATDEQSLLEEICRIVCEEAGYRMAWVGYTEHDEARTVRPVAWTGTEEGYLANLGITWADTERGRGPAGTAIRSGKSCFIQDFAMDPRMATWRESAVLRDFRSGIALPLKDEHGDAFGSLNIYSAQPNAFTSEEIRLLEELAADLAFGIVTLRSRAARERAELALRQSEAYLAESQRLTHTGSWALDLASHKYVYVSEEDFRLWGFDPQEGLPSREAVFRRIHPEDRDKMRASFEKSLREKVDSSDEYRIVLPDGTVKHVHTIRHPVLNGAGDVVKLVGTSVDITERKQAEEALREGETRFRTFVDHAADALFIYDFEQGTIVDVNRQACESLGYTRQELIGTTALAFHLDSNRAQMESVAQRAAAGETVIDTHWHRRRDGTLFPGEVHTSQYWYGGRRFLLKLARDITDRKRAEQALRESEAYLAEGQRLTHTGSFAWSPATRQSIYWSEEMFRIFGLNPQEGVPSEETFWQRIHPEDLDRTRELLLNAADGNMEYEHDHRILLPDGTVKHIHAIGHPVLEEKGQVAKYVGTAVDVTERQRAERERERLRQLEADLAHINRVSMMGELAASIAHEINQPLSGVVVNANACLRWLAGDSPNLEEAREAVRRIVRDGKRAGDVIARIRALATKTPTAKERLDLNEAIREVVAFAGNELRKNRVAVRTELAADLLPVSGDRVQLQQVILNLVMNGIEAMSSVEERPRELIVRTQNEDASQVRVTIQDSGRGLDPQSMERIFDAFYTTKRGGMGMGLAISRSIIQNHGGKLWAVANEEPGLSVQFTIPKYQQ